MKPKDSMNCAENIHKHKWGWLYDLLLVFVLVTAAYFRFVGSKWGDLEHQHPDESFFTSVTYDIQPVNSVSEYFNTAQSTLNPHNRGHGFYVYGTLPVFIVRYTAEWFGRMDHLKLYGRQFSALMDLGTIVLMYFIVRRVYGRRVALLASAFSALAVMQIQQSHFFTTDNFVTFFMFLSLYFAVVISTGAWKDLSHEDCDVNASRFFLVTRQLLSLFRDRLFWLCVGFGLALGMAAASKISAVVMAILLPAALALRFMQKEKNTSKTKQEHVAARGCWASMEGYIIKASPFLFVGALVTLFAFRILQPYAFSGPGFFGLKPNPAWIANMRELQTQASGDADLPWNLQWARRSHLFSFINLTTWGLGLPLGIFAWLGFLWMIWRICKGEWHQHILLWGWTALFFLWQSLQYNATMRYQLPIYPLLAMMAAYLIIQVSAYQLKIKHLTCKLSTLAFILGAFVLISTLLWAFAFLRIYTRPETRVAASEWIYQNLPGPINLRIQASDGSLINQPLPFSAENKIQAETTYEFPFIAQINGNLREIYLPHIVSSPITLTGNLLVSIRQNLGDSQPLASLNVVVPPISSADSTSQTLLFDQSLAVVSKQVYTLRVELVDTDNPVNLCGPISLSIQTNDESFTQDLGILPQCEITSTQSYTMQFTPQVDGEITDITFERVVHMITYDTQTFSLRLATNPDPTPEQVIGRASVTSDFAPTQDARGEPITLKFEQPISMEEGQTYFLQLETNGVPLVVSGVAVANETDYDYGLPFRIDGYDGFGGIYRGDLNLQVYWDDNADKLSRFQNTLDQTDYIFIPTNHQYGQITRLPERYPLTTVYYRELLGCPPDKEIIYCYQAAEPGMFQGNLGFDLIATFESFPNLGLWQINDQPAEEAFTFYDHPKVMVFQKRSDYDSNQIEAILSAVDLSRVVHLTPRQANEYKDLLLPADRLVVQQAGGTWSELFNRNALLNKYPFFGLVVWYATIFLIGLFAYPLVRLALPGLSDRGYPLARVAGLVIWAWFSWLAGSMRIPYNKATISAGLGLIVLIGLILAYRQREELKEEWKTRRKYFLMIESLFLAFFLLDLLIRIGNPDLWHPTNGGERPMNFSYFNAILKSTTFPPYDPWFSGGYINYYYYGYVIVGTPVKFLGIVPSIAYNFILPTLFACLALGAFSVVWNLLVHKNPVEKNTWKSILGQQSFIGGIAAAAGMVLFGNFGIARLFLRGFMCIAAPSKWISDANIHDCVIAPGGLIDKVNIFQRIGWTLKGFFQYLAGVDIPLSARDWFWWPTRALPPSSGDPINEFPLFTFLWSDLHAHMIALPLTVLAIAWVLSMLLALRNAANSDQHCSWFTLCIPLLFGALIIGSLKPTNTWDFYTYVLLACLVLIYAIWRYRKGIHFKKNLPSWLKRLVLIGGAITALVWFSLLFYQPFSHWFSQAYKSFELWRGGRSDISSYLVHWGAFFFFVVSWMVWETHEWMADTPFSSLRKLKPYRGLIFGVIFTLLLIVVAQQYWVMSPSQNVLWKGASILWLALPLATWAGILIIRPGLSDTKRLILFIFGTGLVLTMVVENFVVRGDVGRMNTVFKFYNQAWVLFSLSAAAAFGWLLGEIEKWIPRWRAIWQFTATIITACMLLFLLVVGMVKIRDRMSLNTPLTLDSMEYMAYSHYSEYGMDIDLSQDYRAIRWIQENIQGSPVIVEAAPAGVQYDWHSRFSIYTGLPCVVGWEWHQIQQRGHVMGSQVVNRGVEVNDFYSTTDSSLASSFLSRYNVKYILIGQLERAKYAQTGLEKFKTLDGVLWQEVYRDGETVIYEVLP